MIAKLMNFPFLLAFGLNVAIYTCAADNFPLYGTSSDVEGK